jgi:hypothetical protein
VNSTVRALVEGILQDLIEARHTADLTAADLASRYRDNATLRHLTIPTLNVSTVSVDLRFVLSGESPEDVAGPKIDLDEAADNVAEVVLRAPSVTRAELSGRARSALSTRLSKAIEAELEARMAEPESETRVPVRDAILTALGASGIRRVPATEMREIDEAIGAIEARIDRATRRHPTPAGIIVGPDTLSGVNPEMVSRLSFRVDLTPKRWIEVEGSGADATSHILTDE